jgi:hypothetical protein
VAFTRRSDSTSSPTTYVGRWLRATLLRQPELRERLRLTLNAGKKTGWNDDEPAVVEAACELVLRRLFAAPDDVRAITAFVSELRIATDDDPPLGKLKTEAVIRSALGEADVVTSNITPGQKYLTRYLVIVFAARKLDLDEAAIDRLIAESEQIALDRGWHPPLAQ